jgi:phosphoserine phosphatase
MAGDLEFKTALIQRVSLLKGLGQSKLNQIREQITLTQGAKKLVDELHQQGH